MIMHQFNKILSELNPEQLDAVSHTEGALLVLAGAGTGKTKVLTTRIAYILQNQLAWPSQVMAVTFTNKASKEMGHRIHQMVGDISSGLWLGTFHSICLKMLRKNYAFANLKENFAVINQDDQIRLIKQIMQEMEIDEKKTHPKGITAIINRWKDKSIIASDVVDGDLAGTIYIEYQKRCESLNIIDFGDIILKTITLLKNNPDVLAEYHRRFKYILVDEYQDTNVAQYLWLRLLAQSSHNICCVGDDDQSIYGWRGAEVGNILRFEKDFKDAKIVRLETNYRSTSQILSAADSVIANNQNRLGKTLKASKGEGETIKLVSLWDDRAEANYIADEIEALQQIYKQRLDDMAILVRAGYQTRAFEESFLKRAIPYRILGGLRFYERMEIRDMIAYIRTIITPENDLALDRIINVPKRGLGDKTIDDLKKIAREQNKSLSDTIIEAVKNNALKPRPKEALRKLFDDIARWRNDFQNENHVEVVERIMEQSGYLQMWEAEKTIEAKGRVENLKELINALAQFEDIFQFLEHVSLVADADDRPVDDMISIMTIHGAKGLEFENVFLPGWEEGLFPSQQSMDELGKEGLEEERRLAYVAITRAKRRLTISFCSGRMVFGNIINPIPSRFVDELPQDQVEIINKAGLGPNYKGRNQKPNFGKNNFGKSNFDDNDLEFSGYQSGKNNANGLGEKAGRFEIPSIQNNFSAKNIKDKIVGAKGKFSVGDKVNHPAFGVGRVLNVNGKHVQIVFEKAAIKTLLEDFVEAA